MAALAPEPLFLILLPFQTYAQNNSVITGGLAEGGDTIVERNNSSSIIRFENNEKIRAGRGARFELGHRLNLSKAVSLRYSLGYKYFDVSYSGTTHSISTIPANAFLLYKIKRVSLGGGLSYHFIPTYKAENQGSIIDTATFDNALGVTALLNIRVSRSQLFSIDIRYTHIKYQGAPAPRNNTGTRAERSKTRFDASNLSVSGVFTFF